METLKKEAENKAAPVALRLAKTVRQIYENMLSDRPDEKLRMELSRELKEAAGELLDIKGASIRETVNLLDKEQKAILKEAAMRPDAPTDLSEVVQSLFAIHNSAK